MLVAEVCGRHSINSPTYYGRKSKCASAAVSDLARIRALEMENARLKRMYADLAMDIA